MRARTWVAIPILAALPLLVWLSSAALGQGNSAAAHYAVDNLPPWQRGTVVSQGAKGTSVIPTSTPTRTPTDTPTWTPTQTPTATLTDTPCYAPASRCFQTGQTDCDDGSGDTIPSAPCPGTPPGQDGELQKGAARSYTDNGDGTITDNQTGLMWEKLANDGSIHDYTTWYSWSDGFAKIGSLNSASFAGHGDWRMPNVGELASLIRYDHGPGIDEVFNQNCASGCTVSDCSCTGDPYWSSTEGAFDPNHPAPWVARYHYFMILVFGTTSTAGVRGVRGGGGPVQVLRTGATQCEQGDGTLGACPGSPAEQDAALGLGLSRSYVDNGDGTVVDNRTGLMWEKLSHDGSIHDFMNQYTWYTAFSSKLATLNATSFAGHSDWRVPNINELLSLSDYGRTRPAIDPMFNSGCTNGCTVLTCSCTAQGEFWSSTSFESLNSGSPSAWTWNSEGGTFEFDKSFLFSSGPFMRAVRDVTWEATTCSEQSASCGTISDGCGGTLDCGSCTETQVCGGGGIAGQCCTPTTCAAQGVECGSIPNGCGGTLNCGSCTAPDTCGGGGVVNQCGCTPVDTATICSNADQVCGSRVNNCGQSVSCGSCPSNVPKCCFDRCVSTPECP